MGKKLCFVVQRYGMEVNGGAEQHCRMWAEHMLDKCDEIHVLTSKAVDYMTWENVYEADEEEINGITVHRFPVEHTRDMDAFNRINGRFMTGQLAQDEEEEWVEKQGPAVPKLIRYIEDNKDNFDVFIFFTYLYYPTVMGVDKVAKKAIVVPDAHDEPFLRMKIYDRVFKSPAALFFNVDEERNLIHQKYNNSDIPYAIGGIGLDLPADIDGERFKKKFGLDNYIVYVGRIDEGKNCSQMFEYFRRYKDKYADDLKLVTIGKAFVQVPEADDIVNLGFLPDDCDKYDGIKGAKALWLPSKFESLSMVVLEAMSVETPVIVNGECPVLKGHCIKSNGAFYYDSYEVFEQELKFYLNCKTQTDVMKKNAKKYVDENYQWDVLTEKFARLIDRVR